MTDIILAAIIVAIVALAVRYIYKAKKSGAKCIGCSVGNGCCSRAKASEAGCGCGGEASAVAEETGACCCCQSGETK